MLKEDQRSKKAKLRFGGEGGRAFGPVPVINSIGLRSKHLVDQIRIDGVSYWKNNGDYKPDIMLAPDEYISRVDIREGQYIDYVKFTTNKGQSIEGGDPKAGVKGTTLDKIRVLAIGGRADASIDQLYIYFIKNYQPSVVVVEDATFIVDFAVPGKTIREFETKEQRIAESFTRTSTTQQTLQFNVSVEAEYYAKATVSTGIELRWEQSETRSKDLESKITSGREETITLGADKVGVKLVSGNIMKAPDGEFWMYPTGPTSLVTWNKDDVGKLFGKYALNKFLTEQMEGFKSAYLQNKNGFVYYEKQ